MNEQRWLILIYRLPREPSRPRVAVDHKLIHYTDAIFDGLYTYLSWEVL